MLLFCKRPLLYAYGWLLVRFPGRTKPVNWPLFLSFLRFWAHNVREDLAFPKSASACGNVHLRRGLTRLLSATTGKWDMEPHLKNGFGKGTASAVPPGANRSAGFCP
jgi:hypothetical protein